jgi:hypothetical protein
VESTLLSDVKARGRAQLMRRGPQPIIKTNYKKMRGVGTYYPNGGHSFKWEIT